jgi:hypothetical protein
VTDPDVTHHAPAGVTDSASRDEPLSAAERARRYRRRKKHSTGHGPANGSREPFQPGNEAALVHGASSERHIAPRAAQIAADLLNHQGCPPYLKEPGYTPVVRAWSRAEAVVSLLWDWLAEHDLDDALTDLTTVDEDEEHAKGSATRHTVSRRVESVLTQLHRHEVRAMNLRSRLGLDPLSRARLGKDITAQRLDLAQLFAQMTATDRKDG